MTNALARIPSVRNPNGIVITDEIRSSFPAVFAETPTHMSDKYQFYPSYQLIEDMDKFGMSLVQLGQQNSSKRDPRGQLHVMRFQPKGVEARLSTKVGDSNLELCILNSHNGRNRFQAYAGIFRLLCLNGMVASTADLGQVRTKHFGVNNNYDVIKGLIDGMAQNVGLLGGKISAWQDMILTEDQQLELARLTLDVRKFPEWLDADQLLIERRPDEAAFNGQRDLWTTFNVIQENVMKGDIDRTGGGRPSHTRAVSGAFADVATNIALWDRLEAFTTALDGGKPKAPVHEPEVQAAQDKVESAEDRRKRQKRESAARVRAKAKEVAQ